MTTTPPPIRWGILGCGRIAEKFVRSLAVVPSGRLVACASRTPGKARAFADRFAIPHAFPDYAPMLDGDQLDAVYIATTHNFHLDNLLLALARGKAVLCEKPLTVSADQTARAVEAARTSGCFLMEGLWTRFLPAIRRMKEWLDAGAIGQVKMLRADFCFRAPLDPQGRLYNPDLAGGALLDAGIYPVSMASFIMGGPPRRIAAFTDRAPTGVDQQHASLFDYGDGRLAVLTSAIASASNNRLEIAGTEGVLRIPEQFLRAQSVELHAGDRVTREEHPFPDPEGFRFEIEAVHHALHHGQRECPLMPLDESLAIAHTLDTLRA